MRELRLKFWVLESLKGDRVSNIFSRVTPTNVGDSAPQDRRRRRPWNWEIALDVAHLLAQAVVNAADISRRFVAGQRREVGARLVCVRWSDARVEVRQTDEDVGAAGT